MLEFGRYFVRRTNASSMGLANTELINTVMITIINHHTSSLQHFGRVALAKTISCPEKPLTTSAQCSSPVSSEGFRSLLPGKLGAQIHLVHSIFHNSYHREKRI